MPASHLGEFRHARSGSLNIASHNGNGAGVMGPSSAAGPQRFDSARSPPNTSHVPCKFFRQGACQAGNACPFSHDIGSAAETVCKYFTKGNCKFGPKCANVHVLPDGRRVNYGKNGVTIGAPPINLGGRVNPSTYHHPSSSALTNSFLRADNMSAGFSGSNDDRYGYNAHQSLSHQSSIDGNGLPIIDTTYSSNPTSIYGSPRDEDVASRFGLGLSPVNGNHKGLSVLDAPLPASFDSNGISLAARYGPWPSSVPSKFGLDSPSPSLRASKDVRASETLKLLHTSAFGSSDRLSTSAAAHDAPGLISGSPILPPSSMADDFSNKQRATLMHSSSQRYARSRLISSSVPKVDRDWEAEFLFEEDYVPGTLANEVLTPAEKARRGSTNAILSLRAAADGSETTPNSESLATATKFGSPITAASPSRWGPLFQRQREEELEFGSLGSGGRSMKHAVSAFGHVGSPLRNSSLASNIGQLSGSPSGRHGAESLSVLTQQLQRTRLGEDGSAGSSPRLHPNSARSASGTMLGAVGSGIMGRDRDREKGLERHVSSGSIGSSVTGRFTTPIDEEDPSFVFSMEEVDGRDIRSRKPTTTTYVSGPQVSLDPSNGPSTTWSYPSGAPPPSNGGSSRDGPSAVQVGGSR